MRSVSRMASSFKNKRSGSSRSLYASMGMQVHRTPSGAAGDHDFGGSPTGRGTPPVLSRAPSSRSARRFSSVDTFSRLASSASQAMPSVQEHDILPLSSPRALNSLPTPRVVSEGLHQQAQDHEPAISRTPSILRSGGAVSGAPAKNVKFTRRKSPGLTIQGTDSIPAEDEVRPIPNGTCQTSHVPCVSMHDICNACVE
jgi:hypothetical protein